ncbi:MAG: transposase [Draconibacterium sp.]|nr:transposase [Draconibacterium sp.]
MAHDPDTGIIGYGKTDIKHKNESDTVLEFLGFNRDNKQGGNPLKYIVFDSKFTNYGNLGKLDDNNVKFITIRRRGVKLVEEIRSIPSKGWKTIRVEQPGNKKRTIKVYEQTVYFKGYGKNIRQIYITGNGKIKPAVTITNDFEKSLNEIVKKYARRWLVEKVISEQIEFFHLNRVSSSMVIKVDFDLTMSIMAHNIYRLFALDLEGYSHLTSQSLYEKFISNPADVEITKKKIIVKLKKKRNLPMILENMNKFKELNIPWLNNKQMVYEGATYS